jgi:hypothetical protein
VAWSRAELYRRSNNRAMRVAMALNRDGVPALANA